MSYGHSGSQRRLEEEVESLRNQQGGDIITVRGPGPRRPTNNAGATRRRPFPRLPHVTNPATYSYPAGSLPWNMQPSGRAVLPPMQQVALSRATTPVFVAFHQQGAASFQRATAATVLQVPGGAGPRLDSNNAAPANVVQMPFVNQSGPGCNIRHVAARAYEGSKAAATNLAHRPKIEEFYAFCNIACIDEEIGTRYLVTESKLYRFLWYHAFCEQKGRGGKKRGANGDFKEPEPPAFNARVYRDLLAKYEGLPDDSSPPDPKNPIGKEALSQYKNALKHLHHMQKTVHVTVSTRWEDVFTDDAQKLVEIVRERKPRIRKASYKEKVNGEFAPFLYLEAVPKIEKKTV